MSQVDTSKPAGPNKAKNVFDRSLDAMYQTIVVDAHTDAPKLPEEIFVNYFLPVFAFKREMSEKIMAEWISIAGQPSAEVSIINTAGVELYKVPSLFNTSHINRLRPEGALDFASMGKMLEMQSYSSPSKAEFEYRSRLLERYKKSHQPGSDIPINEKRWLEIFHKYGYLGVNEQTEQQIKEKENKQTAQDNDIGDDEFVSR